MNRTEAATVVAVVAILAGIVCEFAADAFWNKGLADEIGLAAVLAVGLIGAFIVFRRTK